MKIEVKLPENQEVLFKDMPEGSYGEIVGGSYSGTKVRRTYDTVCALDEGVSSWKTNAPHKVKLYPHGTVITITV